MFQDLRYALRTLARSPGFTAIVIATLALGIGANTAIFSLVNTIFLRALPYPHPDELVSLSDRDSQGNGRMPVSYPNFLDCQARQDVFSALAAAHGAQGKLRTPHGTELVDLLQVSAGFFDVLQVTPEQGRTMAADDDTPGAARAAWITHKAWQRFFDGAPDVVGRTLPLDGRELTVAGVLPEGFRYSRDVDMVTALAPFVRENMLDMRASHSGTYGIARLKPGVSVEMAAAQLRDISAQLAEEYPEENKGVSTGVVSLREDLAGGARTRIFLLLGAVGLVLLIACVNVANMLLARSFSREREIAIRTSIGASRWHLLRQLLTESLVLAAAGGAAGALVGVWGYQFASRLVPGQVQRVIESNGFDGRMLLYVLGITLVTGIAFGLAPAWQLSQIRPVDALKQTNREVHTLFGSLRLSDLLVIVQVALALVLLVSAGLMIRSLDRLLDVDPGYEPTRVLTVKVTAPPTELFQRDPGAFARHFEAVVEAVQRLPEVEAAAVASGLPFTGDTNVMTLYCGDRPVPAAGDFPSASVHSVSPDYFRAMGIPLLRGRTFDGTEPAVVLPEGVEVTQQNLARIFDGFVLSGVISRNMAERFWPGEDPIGKRFRLGYPNMGLPWVDVVGVVGSTVQFGLDRGESTEFYLCLHQWPVPISMHLAVRSRLAPATVVNSVRAAVGSVAPDVPLLDIRVLSERIEGSTTDRRFQRNLFACFAATALVLAVIGLYGVLAFNVGRRTREVGIRMALGANRRDVVRSVVVRGLALAVPGLIVGFVFAWIAGRLLQSQLFEVSGADPLTYIVGGVLLLVTAGAAAFVPARRAARVDPMIALRIE